MADQIQIGSVVRLKSGGPKMTVTNQMGNGHLACSWFEESANKSGVFPPAALELVS